MIVTFFTESTVDFSCMSPKLICYYENVEELIFFESELPSIRISGLDFPSPFLFGDTNSQEVPPFFLILIDHRGNPKTNVTKLLRGNVWQVSDNPTHKNLSTRVSSSACGFGVKNCWPMLKYYHR